MYSSLFKYENIIDFIDFNKTIAYLKFLTKLLTSCCETGQEEYVRAWTTAPPLSISKWTNRNVIYQRRTVRFAIIHHRLMNYILFTRSEEFLIDPLPLMLRLINWFKGFVVVELKNLQSSLGNHRLEGVQLDEDGSGMLRGFGKPV